MLTCPHPCPHCCKQPGCCQQQLNKGSSSAYCRKKKKTLPESNMIHSLLFKMIAFMLSLLREGGKIAQRWRKTKVKGEIDEEEQTHTSLCSPGTTPACTFLIKQHFLLHPTSQVGLEIEAKTSFAEAGLSPSEGGSSAFSLPRAVLSGPWRRAGGYQESSAGQTHCPAFLNEVTGKSHSRDAASLVGIPWPCDESFRMAQCTHPQDKSDERGDRCLGFAWHDSEGPSCSRAVIKCSLTDAG